MTRSDPDLDGICSRLTLSATIGLNFRALQSDFSCSEFLDNRP